jgi:hypothetical protein
MKSIYGSLKCDVGVVIVTVILSQASNILAQSASTFIMAGTMTTPRNEPTALLLPDGRVFITGGTSAPFSAELYDASTGDFTALVGMTSSGQFAVRLSDGRVLIPGDDPAKTSQIYNPTTGQFVATGNRATKGGGLATLLADGRVWFIGGGPSLVSSEVYDPSTGVFATLNDAPQPAPNTATLLRNGKVLLTWSVEYSRSEVYVRHAAVYDPSTDTYAFNPDMNFYHAGPTATLLKNGKVLVAGGDIGDGDGPSVKAELFDPETGSFAVTGDLTTGREGHTATLLPDGSVLITGGHGGVPVPGGGFDNLASAELYDPVTGTFHRTGSMATGREYHGATLLNDGRVLITGGWEYYWCCAGNRSPSGGALASAELYTPLDNNSPAAVSASADRTSVQLGGSFVTKFTGPNLSDRTYFDVRFLSPGSGTDGVAFNWQQGLSVAHDVSADTEVGTWAITAVRAHEDADDHGADYFPVLVVMTVRASSLVVANVALDPPIVRAGESFVATFTGTNLAADTYFDVRFHGPDNDADQVAPNWQTGLTANHTVPIGLAPGVWSMTGIWVHQGANNHSSDFVPVSAAITVAP